MLQHVSVLHPFLRLSNIPPYGWTAVSLLLIGLMDTRGFEALG